MISVSLIGGLGNQMFQYAAGKALAERHGVPLALDLTGFRNYALRSFLLNRLCVPEADQAIPADAGKPVISVSSSRWKQQFGRMLSRAGVLKPVGKHYCEPYFHFDPAFEALGPQTSLSGYFQSERYFGSIANLLREYFLPREPLSQAAAAVLARIEASPLSVSVHVRRGDYLNAGTVEFHGILGEDYYRRAFDRLESAVGQKADLFVFSDDAAAAAQVLSFVPQSRLVHACGDPERPWEDMALMARCHHHVIANSSFSWWGAWLNAKSDKIVLAPQAWFSARELRQRNTSDLCPHDWILV